MDQTINLEEAAKFLGFKSKCALSIKAKQGLIPGFKAGKNWMFYVPDLVDYIRSQYAMRRESEQVVIRGKELCQSAKRKTALTIIQGSRSAELEYKNLREQLLNQRRNDTKKSASVK